MDGITVGEFIELLYPGDKDRDSQIRRGLIDARDREDPGRPLTRADAARLIHMYLKLSKGVRDIPDISRASELRDLYDCRLCADHIAQVYLRGIMEGYVIDGIGEKTFCIFDSRRIMSDDDVKDCLKNMPP